MVTAIAGMAGVGKTALTLEWAHHHTDQFPDGQLFIDLRGYDLVEPLTPVEALAALLTLLSVPPDKISPDLDTAAAHYRSLLANRRVLIVLDNAASAEQVRPLLPGDSASTVIITSRQALTGLVARDGGVLMHLGMLTPAESVQLLGYVLGHGHDPDELAQLAELCGHLPLALRIAAARLAAEPWRPVSALVEDLREAGRIAGLQIQDDPRSAMSVVFEQSYQALPPAEQRLFLLLSLLPSAGFSVAAAAAVSGMAEDVAAGGLRLLVRAHLVIEREPGRFTLHDLLREYAFSLCDPPSIPRHLSDLADWYVSSAEAAVARLHPDRPADTSLTEREAAAWLATERSGLVTTVTLLAQYDLPQSWQLTTTLRLYLAHRAPLELVSAGRAALAAAERAGDPRAQVTVHFALTTALNLLARPAAALGHAERAAELLKDLDWPEGEIMACNQLAAAHFVAGGLAVSAGYSRRALIASTRLGDHLNQALALSWLSLTAHLRGRLTEAVEWQEQSVKLSKEFGTPTGLVSGLVNLAELRHLTGRSDEALELLADAERRIADLDNWALSAATSATVAQVKRDLGDLDGALVAARAATAHFPEAEGDNETRIRTQQVLATVRAEMGELDQAADLLEASLLASATLSLRHTETGILIDLADVLHRLGRRQEAAARARRAVELAQEHDYALLAERARRLTCDTP